ncbi:glycosyltransferase family 2 protein [Candidatus Methylomirabilis sp.]|uniref:Glycosyltransferase family 2 protein n=1 Tax=Candidatus Methylomirabilis tolerans TaxID=3123416 RepID=A0AAJ1AFM6_9BACT|nr:glycosyltransferase family 2 protein [Candidatus Methylomirabilis sp.]
MTAVRADISVVIPLYNEAESLHELHAALAAALLPYADRCEMIFVDDGSTDGSFDVLKSLREGDKRLKVVRLRSNQGKAVALAAGFREAQGEIIVTLDADLQDDPKEIPRFLQKLEEGYGLVSGWKATRRDPWSRRFLSTLFNCVTSRLTGVQLHDFNCGFKAYRRSVIQELKLYGELHRFIPALASWRGFRIGEMEVAHRSRKYGRSKYGSERIPKGFFDLLTVLMLTRYTTRPLHLFGVLGVFTGIAGLAIIAYLSVGWLFGQWIGPRPLFILGTLMVIAGIQLVSFGLLAEMIVYGSNRGIDPPVDLILK